MDTDYDKELNQIIENIKQKLVISENNDDNLLENPSLDESFIEPVIKHEENVVIEKSLEESFIEPVIKDEESIDNKPILEENINVDQSFEHEESIDDDSSLEESINQIQEILNNHKEPIVKLNEVEDNTFSNNHKQKLDEINDERFKKLFDVIIDDEDNTQKNYIVEGVIKNKNYGFCMII